MNKKIFLLLVLVLLVGGCNSYQLEQEYDKGFNEGYTVGKANCLECYCRCNPEPITYFEYGSQDIYLFDDKGLLIKKDTIPSYTKKSYILTIKNYGYDSSESPKDLCGKKICIEHKFERLEIKGLDKVSIPNGYILQSVPYVLRCWGFPQSMPDFVDYKLMIEQGLNTNQTVIISIWGKEE